MLRSWLWQLFFALCGVLSFGIFLLSFPFSALAATHTSASSQFGATTSLLVFGSIAICVATVAVILLVLVTMRLNRRRLMEEDEESSSEV